MTRTMDENEGSFPALESGERKFQQLQQGHGIL